MLEMNDTFYRRPNSKTVAGWNAATPAAFTFVLKAPQRITHIARLRDVDDPLRYFLETGRKLGPKLGPILFQLPPNFKKDRPELGAQPRSEEHTSELQSRLHVVCRRLLDNKPAREGW